MNKLSQNRLIIWAARIAVGLLLLLFAAGCGNATPPAVPTSVAQPALTPTPIGLWTLYGSDPVSYEPVPADVTGLTVSNTIHNVQRGDSLSAIIHLTYRDAQGSVTDEVPVETEAQPLGPSGVFAVHTPLDTSRTLIRYDIQIKVFRNGALVLDRHRLTINTLAQ